MSVLRIMRIHARDEGQEENNKKAGEKRANRDHGRKKETAIRYVSQVFLFFDDVNITIDGFSMEKAERRPSRLFRSCCSQR